MSQWITPLQTRFEVDPEILEEAALATAQSTIQNAIDEAGISRTDLADAMGCQRSFVSRMLSGSHNLTIKTMARALAACGFEPDFGYKPITWSLVDVAAPPESCVTPACAGVPVLAT
jgi:hypothetical protein